MKQFQTTSKEIFLQDYLLLSHSMIYEDGHQQIHKVRKESVHDTIHRVTEMRKNAAPLSS